MASRRSTISTASHPETPADTCATMAAGSSVRGLSDVTTARSAYRATAAPIAGRLAVSRSPPAPKTTISRPGTRGRIAASTLSRASGVCAKSMNTWNGSRATHSSRPATGSAPLSPSATSSRVRPSASAHAAAQSALETLKSPGSASVTGATRPFHARPNDDPREDMRTSRARSAAAPNP